MNSILPNAVLDQVFRTARTQNGWSAQPVTDAQLQELYALAVWGPTSANCQPMRIKFVRSGPAKERLLAGVAPGNVEKTRQAPVTAVLGYDMAFYEHVPRMFPPHPPMKEVFSSSPEMILTSAIRNGSLQGAYLIIAARMLGLDAGPMSGYNSATVDAAFWSGTEVKTNFLCNLGYGDASKVMPRLPRFDFKEVCEIL